VRITLRPTWSGVGALALTLVLSTAVPDGARSASSASQGTWQAAGSSLTPRAAHTASLLGDGRVLVAGGAGPSNKILDSAEIFDPTSDTWSSAAFVTSASATPSPLKSLVASSTSLLARRAGWKVPSPLPKSTLTVLPR